MSPLPWTQECERVTQFATPPKQDARPDGPARAAAAIGGAPHFPEEFMHTKLTAAALAGSFAAALAIASAFAATFPGTDCRLWPGSSKS